MLKLREISKSYGSKQALSSVSLELTEGIYGLLGPNGAGKSTLMNIITGNLRPDTGAVMWKEEEISSLGVKFRSILGYAPQQQGLYDAFSGRDFLKYMAVLKGISRKHIREEVDRVLSYVNLQEAADFAIGTYSGGMKQRILIAQAVMGNPNLIILDEPTAGLDPKERVRIREKIKEISREKIILVSTHVVSDIQSIAKEIILLKAGSVIDQDTVDALCGKYKGADDLEQVYMHIFGEQEGEENASTDSL